ncbi:helix-turn-helix domain-containing protein [Streptomyces sp. NBC_01283]|uniref:helix-turn-helix domain-containing protein n=1 Tax=Streptomyces sp. NBC_01283 TaxID=2903812 RepID=UPI00352DC57C|nr:helix-turn-helix domain-containing protein [Streptomyces sp. NBC_01283]
MPIGAVTPVLGEHDGDLAGIEMLLAPWAAFALQRARRMLAAGRIQTETAAACGFYDQAHPSGEFRAMTGCTPREFAAVRRTLRGPGCDPPSSDRLADEPTSLIQA